MEGTSLSGHDDVVTIETDNFQRMVDLVEAAFVNLHAAFYWDPTEGGHVVDVFDFGDEFAGVDEWVEAREFASAVQPLLLFAFEEAPDAVVVRWGEEHVAGSGTVALERVGYIRENMESARREWATRFNNLGNLLGNLTTSVVYSPETGDFRTIIRLNSFTADGVRKIPSASSRQHLSAVVSRNELRRLIDTLQMADAFYPDDDSVSSNDVRADASPDDLDSQA